MEAEKSIARKVVAVTGISGYFGSILLPLLEADDQISAIRGFDRLPPPSVPSESKLEFYPMDINDPGFEPLIRGSDTLVHLAFKLMRLPGEVSTNKRSRKHNSKATDIDETNIAGMRATCEAAARQGVRKLIVTSSVVAYGLHADNPAFLSEDAPLRPNDDLYYGMAKASNERFLDDFEQMHTEMIITRLRPCTTIGPRANPAMMASLTTNPTILVRGYNPFIQLIHEDDVASALHLAIRNDLPGIYNVVSDEPCTLRDLVRMRAGRSIALPYFLVKMMMALTWRLGLSVFAPEWIDLSRFSIVASNAKLKAAGWQPKYTTSQAFAELMATLPGTTSTAQV